MKGKAIYTLLCLMIIVSVLLISCTPESTPTPTAATSTPTAGTSTPTVAANWWDEWGEPTYGGELVIRADDLSVVSIDPSNMMGAMYQNWLETLFVADWEVDRAEWPYYFSFLPADKMSGCLAESWEQTSPTTITVHIREGVYWQDKPPVNGREFTADDVVFNYDRFLGTGDFEGQGSPFFAGNMPTIERAVAIDNYTVEFKLKEPTAYGIYQVMFEVGFASPEQIEAAATGQVSQNEWEDAVGTGPWLLTEFTPGVSLTFSRNPDYWGYDEHYPDNQLPYLDTLKNMQIKDISTTLAALRTGKIDMVRDLRSGLTLQHSQNIAQTSPEIKQVLVPTQGYSVIFRCDTEPFIDINVRKALQMAVDVPIIAESHYDGNVEGKPAGLIYEGFTDYTDPYDEWPAELQAEYSYDLDGAKALLTDAGYPDGFSTNCVASSSADLELLQIIQSQFADVGVDMEIVVKDQNGFMSFAQGGKHDQMIFETNTAQTNYPWTNLTMRYSGERRNYSFNNDAYYDSLIAQMNAASGMDEVQSIAKEADMYALEQHWSVNICSTVVPVVWAPWIKGYSGENLGPQRLGSLLARAWCDETLK